MCAGCSKRCGVERAGHRCDRRALADRGGHRPSDRGELRVLGSGDEQRRHLERCESVVGRGLRARADRPQRASEADSGVHSARWPVCWVGSGARTAVGRATHRETLRARELVRPAGRGGRRDARRGPAGAALILVGDASGGTDEDEALHQIGERAARVRQTRPPGVSEVGRPTTDLAEESRGVEKVGGFDLTGSRPGRSTERTSWVLASAAATVAND